MLFNTHVLKNKVSLRTIADQFSSFFEVLLYVIARNFNGTLSRFNLTSKTLKYGALARTINS